MEERAKELGETYIDALSTDLEAAHLNAYRQCKGHVGALNDMLELNFDEIEATVEEARNRKENYAKYKTDDDHS